MDSALSEASSLLLSTRTSHYDRTDHDPRHPVEEVGRTDGEASRALGSQSPDRTPAVEPSSSGEAASLEADDLLGIYAAGIEFCDVGDEDSHFRDVSSQELVEARNSVANEVLPRREGNMDLQESALRHSTGDSGSTTCRQSCPSGDKCGINGARENKTEDKSHMCPPQEKFAEKNCIQTFQEKYDRYMQGNNERTSSSRDRDSLATNRTLFQKELDKTVAGLETRCDAGMRTLRSSRPSFQFVLHRSAFTQTSCPDNDESEESPSTSQSETKSKATRKSTKSEIPVSTQTEVTDSTAAVRACRKKAKSVKEELPQNKAEEPLLQKRRGRKAVCPIKVVVQQKKGSVKGGRVGRPRARPVKDKQKGLHNKCQECSFSCSRKKDLAAHVKSVHEENSKLSKVTFQIGTRKRKRMSAGDKIANCQVEPTKVAGKVSSDITDQKEIKPRKRRTRNSNKRLSPVRDGNPVEQSMTKKMFFQ